MVVILVLATVHVAFGQTDLLVREMRAQSTDVPAQLSLGLPNVDPFLAMIGRRRGGSVWGRVVNPISMQQEQRIDIITTISSYIHPRLRLLADSLAYHQLI